MKHITKDGKKIDLKDLETGHLKNIIAMIERRAKAGIVVCYAGGGFHDIDDIWFDTETLYGNAALEHLNHAKYVVELGRREKKYLLTKK